MTPGLQRVQDAVSVTPVKLRTKVTRGVGSPAAALAMVFNLVESELVRSISAAGRDSPVPQAVASDAQSVLSSSS
ncbi:hypothetical protein [Streptomyces sp. NPDC047981]|uniref:hypothetical protein n=1 Tax=Streptomyces sp. NPDC047981 TaxID=3154610 RepID=UPI003440938D